MKKRKCLFLGPTPDLYNHTLRKASLVAQMVKNLPANAGDLHEFNRWVRKIPWRRKWQPIPVFLPGEIPWTEESKTQIQLSD